MSAKHAFVIMALLMATIGLSIADIPNLVGNWSGSSEGYRAQVGYVNANRTEDLTLVISEQRGRVFTGNFNINVSIPQRVLVQRVEGFSGVIGLDNKTLYIAEHDQGYSIGTILSNDTLEFVYIEDGGEGGAFIDRYYRTE